MTTIDMQTMRYINLLSKVSYVKTSKCFSYNNVIIFAVPKEMMSKAIGPNGRNVHFIQETLGRRVKIIREASNINDAERFIKDIVDPLEFRSLELKDGEFVLTAGGQHKAALIGRNRARLNELSQILEDTFGKPLKII